MTTDPHQPTTTAETEKKYTCRAKGLIRSYLKEHSEHRARSIPSEDFGYWLISRKPTIVQVTWRQYRACILYYARRSRLLDYDVLHHVLHSEEEKSTRCAETAAYQRSKLVRINDVLVIKDYLLRPGRRCLESHEATFNFFMASIIAGLRPCEWKKCTIEFHVLNTIVEVVNAKHTNGRGFGKTRKVHVDSTEAEEIFFIKETIKFMDDMRNECSSDKEFKKKYADRIAAMQKQFRVMNAALFPKRKKKIHLYSARHQASANFKSMGFSRAEVAALMGHASTDTAAVHYGKKSKGRGGDSPKVKPDPRDVAKVEALNVDREPSIYIPKEQRNVSTKIASDLANGAATAAQVSEATSPAPDYARQEAEPGFPKNFQLRLEQIDTEKTQKPSGGLSLG